MLAVKLFGRYLLCWTDTSWFEIIKRMSCTLYQNPNYTGCSYKVYGQNSNLSCFSDQTSSIIIHSGIWLFYDCPGYSGKVVVLYPGYYANLCTMGMNNIISSCRSIPSTYCTQIFLFAEKNYGGRMITLTGSDCNLCDNGFDNATSSFIITGGTWSMYNNPCYCSCLGTYRQGFYPDLQCADNKVSSIQLVGCW